MEDYSTLLAQIRVELRRVGETLNSDRVTKWCCRTGYNSLYDLDKQGLEGLLNAVKRIKTNDQRRTQS